MKRTVLLVVLTTTGSAANNVILDCMRNYTFADTPVPAAEEPSCTWDAYADFVAGAGLSWTDDAGTEAVRATTGANGGSVLLDSPVYAELTSSITTALSIVDMLRLALGDEAYATRTEPVTVDMIGWAFHWTVRAEVDGTSNTVDVSKWDAGLQRETRLFWGARIGGALKRMLPLVESVTIRGYGPEAPRVERTPLRDDGWLMLELYAGVFDALSEPAPTLTLLENSGMHDDLWPSDGGCVSDKGDLEVLTRAELDRRKGSGATDGVGLGCLWRDTIELLRDSGRLVYATSYSSHEHLSAVGNLRAIGATLVRAYPNGFREEGSRVVRMDLLRQANPMVESLLDDTPRPWGSKEAQYATTAAIWRHRIEVGGYERQLRLSRNSHVLAFRGGDGVASRTVAHKKYDELWYKHNLASAVRGRLQAMALAASQLPSMPPRQARVLQEVPWLRGDGTASSPPPKPAELPPSRPKAAEAALQRGQQLLEAAETQPAKAAEAKAAFESAVQLAPSDAEAYIGLAGALGGLGDEAGKVRAYRSALKLRSSDAATWSKLGVTLTSLDADQAAACSEEDCAAGAEDAFRQSCSADPTDARQPLNLGRYLAKLSRPAEAIASLYAAAAIDAEYYTEAILSIGTARAQQGRLSEAVAGFEAALRIDGSNDKVRGAIPLMASNAGAVEAMGGSNAVPDLCGTPCQDAVDGSGYTVCAITWADGCGEIPPPAGFSAQSTVAELCGGACAFYVWMLKQQEQPS